MSWYVRSPNVPGRLVLWWAGSVDRVLARRGDQQWNTVIEGATAYADPADAVNAAMVLDEFGELVVVEISDEEREKMIAAQSAREKRIRIDVGDVLIK